MHVWPRRMASPARLLPSAAMVSINVPDSSRSEVVNTPRPKRIENLHQDRQQHFWARHPARLAWGLQLQAPRHTPVPPRHLALSATMHQVDRACD